MASSSSSASTESSASNTNSSDTILKLLFSMCSINKETSTIHLPKFPHIKVAVDNATGISPEMKESIKYSCGVVELSPNQENLLELGDTLVKVELYKEAIEVYEKALNDHCSCQESNTVLSKLGQVFLREKNIKKAVISYTAAALSDEFCALKLSKLYAAIDNYSAAMSLANQLYRQTKIISNTQKFRELVNHVMDCCEQTGFYSLMEEYNRSIEKLTHFTSEEKATFKNRAETLKLNIEAKISQIRAEREQAYQNNYMNLYEALSLQLARYLNHHCPTPGLMNIEQVDKYHQEIIELLESIQSNDLSDRNLLLAEIYMRSYRYFMSRSEENFDLVEMNKRFSGVKRSEELIQNYIRFSLMNSEAYYVLCSILDMTGRFSEIYAIDFSDENQGRTPSPKSLYSDYYGHVSNIDGCYISDQDFLKYCQYYHGLSCGVLGYDSKAVIELLGVVSDKLVREFYPIHLKLLILRLRNINDLSAVEYQRLIKEISMVRDLYKSDDTVFDLKSCGMFIVKKSKTAEQKNDVVTGADVSADAKSGADTNVENKND